MPMKYIRFPDHGTGIDTFIVFTPTINHKDIAARHEKEHGKPISAGFVHLDEDKFVTVSGRSGSLNLGPAEDDQDMIYLFLGGKPL